MKNNTPLEIAAIAMEHPYGLDILALTERLAHSSLLEQNSMPSVLVADHVNVGGEIGMSSMFPRYTELQAKGVDIQSPRLIERVRQYSERIPSAINAWLDWASNIDVFYPTDSLIKAIEQDWR